MHIHIADARRFSCLQPPKILILIIALGVGLRLTAAYSQEERNLTLDDDTLQQPLVALAQGKLQLDYNPEPSAPRRTRKTKQKKKMRKYYYGIRTRAGVSRNLSGNSVVVELFRYIPPTELLKNTYQREIYYYDVKKRQIRADNYADYNARLKKGTPMYLLHGSYQKLRDGEVREEGFFYKGLRQDKWQEFDKEGILLEKIDYQLGITDASNITYYDDAETKVKEIIPIVHGRKQGKYARYYENGVLAEEGMMDNNARVGIWREWYANRQRRRNTQYPMQWYDTKEPMVLQEWDEKGTMIFDIDRGGKLKK